MIRATSYYDKEKIEKMAKDMQRKTIWSSLLLTIILLIMGIVNIVYFFTENNVFSLIVGIGAVAFSVYPIISAFKTNKNSVKRAVEDMGVENGSLEISYEFKEKRAEISLTREGETTLDTLMYKNVSYVKVNKDGLGIYFTNGDMYYIYNDDFTEGSKERLISLFAHNKITVK